MTRYIAPPANLPIVPEPATTYPYNIDTHDVHFRNLAPGDTVERTPVERAMNSMVRPQHLAPYNLYTAL